MTLLNSTSFFDRARSDMDRLRAQAQNHQRQIATGERLARASDDPIASTQLRTLSRLQKLADAGGALAGQLESDMLAGDSTLNSVGNVINRVRELALQGGTETNNALNRAAIGTEIQAMRDTLLALANSKDTAGNAMFGGAGADIAYAEDAGGAVVYQGTDSSGEVDLGDGFKVTRGLTGPEVFTFEHDGVEVDLFALMDEVSTALLEDQPDAAAISGGSAAKLATALDQISHGRAKLGARLNSLDMLGDRGGAAQAAMADRAAALGGIDLTTAITQMQQAMTALEASQASFVRLSSLNLFSLLR